MRIDFEIRKETVIIAILFLCGLLAYPLFMYFGWSYLLSLGFSIPAIIFGVIYLLVGFFGGWGWIILLAVIVGIIWR